MAFPPEGLNSSIALSKGKKVPSPLLYVPVSKATVEVPFHITQDNAETTLRELFTSGWLAGSTNGASEMTLQLRNCEFAFQCNAEWDKLSETGQDSVRFCNECEKEVHRCETDDQLLRAIRSNLCVAIPSPYPTDQPVRRMLLTARICHPMEKPSQRDIRHPWSNLGGIDGNVPLGGAL